MDIVHKNKNRVWEIDFLRGFAVAMLVFDHLMFLVAHIFGPEWRYCAYNNMPFFEDWFLFAKKYWYSDLREFWEPMFAGLFILISGISTTFSKNNFKRGYLLLIFSLLLSIVSYYVMPDNFIHFGVLHLLSACMLTWELINRLANGNKKIIVTITLLISISFAVAEHCIVKYNLPAPNNFAVIFSKTWREQLNPYFSPGDFFPVFRNMSIFMLGASFGNVFYRNKKSLIKNGNLAIFKPINFLGRHSLLFYIFPQLSFMIILALISYFFITGTLVII